MKNVSRLSGLAKHALTFFIHFIHGGFVMAGVIVIGSVGFLATRHGSEGLNPRQLFAEYIGGEAAQISAAKPEELAEPSPNEQAISEKGLSAQQQRLVSAIAKRHKISPVMVETMVRIADKEARANKLDPLLVLAVMTVESGFNPFAESVFGAQGLMQIIPKYHQDKISSDRGGVALFDPEENIRVGTKILRDYLGRAGSLEAALQLYGGASGDPEMSYAQKVLGEQHKLQLIAMSASRHRVVSSRQQNGSPAGGVSSGSQRADWMRLSASHLSDQRRLNRPI